MSKTIMISGARCLILPRTLPIIPFSCFPWKGELPLHNQSQTQKYLFSQFNRVKMLCSISVLFCTAQNFETQNHTQCQTLTERVKFAGVSLGTLCVIDSNQLMNLENTLVLCLGSKHTTQPVSFSLGEVHIVFLSFFL